MHGRRLSFQDMESPADESGRSSRQAVDALLGEKDRIAGGFGELLDARCHVHGVTDEGELQLPAAADSAGITSPVLTGVGFAPVADMTLNAETALTELQAGKLLGAAVGAYCPDEGPALKRWVAAGEPG
jgi:hypothetical protein